MSSRPPQVDPYPAIPCALLYSGDIRAYAKNTSHAKRLFEPFDSKKVKSASYEINWYGTAFWWPEGHDSTTPKSKVLDGDETLEIPRNGIVFIQPRVVFCVPDYLALRFNLHIRLVHRGLLLGTGPLVDPGFEGQLLIPVHNLTDKPLVIRARDGFIWIEVTKVSPLTGPNAPDFEPFPDDKKNVSAQTYFYRASSGAPIRSSIPSIAREVAEARKVIEHYERRAFWTSFASIVGGLVALAALAWTTQGIWRDTFDFVNAARNEVPPAIEKAVATQTSPLRARLEALERDLAAVKQQQSAKGAQASKD